MFFDQITAFPLKKINKDFSHPKIKSFMVSCIEYDYLVTEEVKFKEKAET
jgi:hypothetical protein